MARWMYPPEVAHPGTRDPVDLVVDWARHGLSRELSLAIWRQACADATDGAGRRDIVQARQRFHELAGWIAAHGGRHELDVGRVTRVGLEIDGDSLIPGVGFGLPTPGKQTLVADDARRPTIPEGRLRTVAGPRGPGRRMSASAAEHDRLDYDDCRALGLKQLLRQLGPRKALRRDTIAAAVDSDRSIAGRATGWAEPLPCGGTPAGQAMWHVAERRAVTLYRRATNHGAIDSDDPAIESALQRRGAGEPLPAPLRRDLERDLGIPLVSVRIHVDGLAARAARALGAEAFTVGEDIFFAEGAFAPATRAGRQLLVHELTHVAQSLRGQAARSGDGLSVSRPGDPLEQEAEGAERAVTWSPEVGPSAVGKVQQMFARATAGSAVELPFRPTLERFFGRRLPIMDVFIGRDELREIGARGAAAGHTVVFAESSPSLPAVAHEVAHVLQQEHAGPLTAESSAIAEAGAPAEIEADSAVRAIASGDAAAFSVRERAAPIVHLNRERGPDPTGPIRTNAADVSQHQIKGTPFGDVVAGADVVYEVMMGPEMMSEGSYYSYAWKCINDPSTRGSAPAEVAGPRSYRWNAHWDFAGHHKIVCTVQFHPSGQAPEAPRELGYWQTVRSAEEVQQDKDDEAMLRLVDPTAAAGPGQSPALAPGATKVSPEVAAKILENMAAGQPPFKPELGKGGCSWFVSEGNPYTGIDPVKNVSLPVEIDRTANPITFDEAKLNALHQQQRAQLDMAELEAKYRQYNNLSADQPLNSKARKAIERLADKAAESKMWDQVAAEVKQSSSKVGEVILENSAFSKSGNGKFLVVADAAKIQVKGGMTAVVEALEASGAKVEPVVAQAVEQTAIRLKWAGRVRGAFRYGGRILIVVAIAADVYRIYHARDKVKAIVESAGGWTGATMAAAGFSEVFAPADVAGPWAWAAHGVGLLVAGGIGYWIGSSTTRTIYEIIVEG